MTRSAIDLGRRRLFTRRAVAARAVASEPRPPWSLPEAAFTLACTRCGQCIDACPTGVLVAGEGGFPTVRFASASCTFCGSCACNCPATCFTRAGGPAADAWPLRAAVDETCLESRGVTCRSCEAACDADALRFRPRLGGGSHVRVEQASCTGCGACVASCPVGALTVAAPVPGSAASTSPATMETDR